MKLILPLVTLTCFLAFAKAQSEVPEECNPEKNEKLKTCIEDLNKKYTSAEIMKDADTYCKAVTENAACYSSACCSTDYAKETIEKSQKSVDDVYKQKGWDGSCKLTCGGVCFSSDQVTDVKKLDGSVSKVAMKDLKIGDSVRVGGDKFEKVFAFSHNDKDANSMMVKFTTDHGVVQMSPDHYVRANGEMKPAEEVKESDFLHHYNGTILQIRKIEKVYAKGLHAPHTASGEIIVGGHHASCYTKSIKPSVGHAFLQPWAKLFDMGFEQAGHFLTSVMSNEKVRDTAMKYFGEH